MSGVVKYRDVETALRRGGAKMRHGTGSHRIWFFPTPEQPEGLEYAIPEKREISRH